MSVSGFGQHSGAPYVVPNRFWTPSRGFRSTPNPLEDTTCAVHILSPTGRRPIIAAAALVANRRWGNGLLPFPCPAAALAHRLRAESRVGKHEGTITLAESPPAAAPSQCPKTTRPVPSCCSHEIRIPYGPSAPADVAPVDRGSAGVWMRRTARFESGFCYHGTHQTHGNRIATIHETPLQKFDCRVRV